MDRGQRFSLRSGVDRMLPAANAREGPAEAIQCITDLWWRVHDLVALRIHQRIRRLVRVVGVMTDSVEIEPVGPVVALPLAGFDEFVREMSLPLTRVAIASTRDPASAQDLVQDALLEAFRRWDEISVLDRPDLWVRRVLVNRSVDRARRMRRFAAILPTLRSRAQTSPLGDTIAYWDAVAELEPTRAKVVTLRSAGEYTTPEIADVLDMPEGTVRWHLREARSELRTRLDHESEE